ncbi:chloride channel protein [Tamilnaduibacter salinus]|uniref:Chloride channel protein n=1 Tax=Tamilnaduibacter salinus TaxID=1484056 RepID=A0A2A2I7E6_9GAMM|nr:chloride channel protein [Tamilnaduibacter salinus]PAV27502.1 chloride channel protein [Tamilnaduibacter salinus]
MSSWKDRINLELFPLFRRKLAGVDGLPQLTILGLVSGIITGAVILAFRFAIEWPLATWLPGQTGEAFESLPLLTRSLLPLGGALLLGLLLHRLHISDRKVGVTYILERLNYHQGYISLKSAMVQFITGVGTVVTGQSSGREGPAVHLGAAASSLIGQWMRLPNNSIRTLVACGAAAAISASFNTPIAGVIFAMEVVMMEYTIAGFTPIIMASVSAAVVTQAVYGTTPAFDVPAPTMQSLLEIPWILAIAVAIGVASAGFVRLLVAATRFNHHPITLRMAVAGLIMVPFAALVPEVMGIGYDTVSKAIHGQLTVGVLIGVALAKLVATAVTIGLGMPSGLIGPTIFIGATLGGAFGLIGAQIAPNAVSGIGFYAMLGMGAMMGSVLQAPLAALMALLELTRNPNIILPGMLIITTSSLIANQVFGQRSIFLSVLRSQGMSYQTNPVIQALRRVSVAGIMERSVRRTRRNITLKAARKLLKTEPRWLVIDGQKGPTAAMPAVDLARHLEDHAEELTAAEDASDEPEPAVIDLMKIPANRRDLAPVEFQATLEEALNRFDETKAEALYVTRHGAPGIQRILGLIQRADIEHHYQYKRR